MERQRVVVTGLGAVSSIGIGKQAFWQALLEGKSGISPVSAFDTSAYRVHNGGEVKGFRAEEHLPAGARLPESRASRMAVVAAHQALDDAGLEPSSLALERCGVAMGTTSGEPVEVERFDDAYVAGELRRVGAEFMNNYPCHVIAANVAASVGFEGPNVMIPAACAAGNYAVGYALETLRRGRAEVMLAGGADAFSRITYTGFFRLGAVSPDVPRPFDKNRLGMIPGEGAAVLVLETLESAERRGASIYAEVAGFGLSCDAHHMTAAHPEGDGLARSMLAALADAGMSPEEVSYVSAHGTGTRTNDKLETLALYQVFGPAAARVPMSSIKSMLGHTMGAASAFESVACALAVATDRVPPTTNFQEPDEECALDCVPNQARELVVEVALNNASAFGGNNASVLLAKVRR
ncbi:MAG: beta-ketoacyl-[acyl-carrier-protein] synthase family protein [Thermoanaerobaculia bacterium]